MSGFGLLAIFSRRLFNRRLEGNEESHHGFATGARIAGATFVLLIALGLFGLTLSHDSGRIPQEANTAQHAKAK